MSPIIFLAVVGDEFAPLGGSISRDSNRLKLIRPADASHRPAALHSVR